MNNTAIRRWRMVGILVFAFVAVYLTTLAIAGFAQQPKRAELAVVLGNTVMPDGQPSPRLQARLDTALQLFRAGQVTRIFVSGGIEEPGDRDEAAVMAAYLQAQGVPLGAIVQDNAGKDTMETARHAAALAGSETGVVVVSQWFHLPRTMLAMRRFGLKNVSGAWPHWFEARDAYSFLREAVALPFYAVKPLDPTQ